MDSDNQLSEDEEARLYSMLYYVDSSNNKALEQNSQAKKSESNLKTSNNTTTQGFGPAEKMVNQNTKPPIPLNQTNEIQVHETHLDDESSKQVRKSPVSLENDNSNSINVEEELLVSNDRTKRKISHSGRYWSRDYSDSVKTMYVQIRNVSKRKQKKADKTLVTLLNTRGTGKRKSSEGSPVPDEGDVNIDHDKSGKFTPAKQNKPMFATPTNTSTPALGKSNKSSRMVRNPANVIANMQTINNNQKSPAKGNNNSKRTPLTQTLMKNLTSSRKKAKMNQPSQNSDSILIESSDDDDSVVEVELPNPSHTTIELDSSDESQSGDKSEKSLETNKSTSAVETSVPIEKPASPVPSIVSSTSDDFIQADCSSFNIDNNIGPVFNFKLHGSDFCDAQSENNLESTKKSSPAPSSPKDAAKKQQTVVTSSTRLLNFDSETTFYALPDNSQNNVNQFATPTSQHKRKSTPRVKNYSVSEENYVLPSADVFESESSDIPESVTDIPITTSKKKKKVLSKINCADSTTTNVVTSSVVVEEPIVTNLVGMDESNSASCEFILSKESDVGDGTSNQSKSKKSKKKQKYLESDMNAYYNTICNKDFDHVRIKYSLPKDRELWKIDAADRGRPRKTTVVCGYCNKAGHRSEVCYKKPQICAMCGSTGHRDTRCPNKICLNCGSPNSTFSVDCNSCKSWKNMYCGTCREHGHPTSKCPDLWRRYHLTVKNEVPLVECKKKKARSLLFCSGCAKRGHIINDCNNYIKFSNFKPASPYIFYYTPVYTPDAVRNPSPTETIVIEEDITTQNQSKDSEDKQKIETTFKGKSQSKESANLKTQSKDGEKNRNQTTEVTNKPKNQSKEVINKQKTPMKEDEDKISSSIVETNFGNDLLSLDATKHLVITVSSPCSANNVSNVLRDVKVVENQIDSPLNNEKTKEPFLNKQNKSAGNIELQGSPNQTKTPNNAVMEITELNDDNSSFISLSKFQGELLRTSGSTDFVNKLAQTQDVVTNLYQKNDGFLLRLTGNVSRHFDLRNEILLHLVIGDKMLDRFPRNCIPKDRNKVLEKLYTEMKTLDNKLGNPFTIFRRAEDMIRKIWKDKLMINPTGTKCNKLCRDINKSYRLLNMILIGQAHLNNGIVAYTKLEEAMKFLETQEFATITNEIRDEIGAFYSLIFSSCPRFDYPELLDMYSKINVKQPTNVKNAIPLDKAIQPSKSEKKRMKLAKFVENVVGEFKKNRDNNALWKEKKLNLYFKELLKLEDKIRKGNLSHKERIQSANDLNRMSMYLKSCKKRLKIAQSKEKTV